MKILNKKLVISSFLLASIFTGCSFNSQEPKKVELLSNKDKVIRLLNSIETKDKKPLEYINKNKYIQHNLSINDGIKGFEEILSLVPKNNTKVEIKRVFQDRNYIFTHTKYNLFGPKIGFDIFRFEDGKIVEHWDNLQKIQKTTASGRTQIEGPSEIIDLNKTEKNRQLVKNFIEDILFNKHPEKITNYISTEKYYQHNPFVKDGLKGLAEAIAYLSAKKDMFIYNKTHMVLAEGNFVLSVNEGTWHGKKHSFYDLFRIENGKIVEHWDTIEEIENKDLWANKNGKF